MTLRKLVSDIFKDLKIDPIPPEVQAFIVDQDPVLATAFARYIAAWNDIKALVSDPAEPLSHEGRVDTQ
jgi:hypothetical protein